MHIYAESHLVHFLSEREERRGIDLRDLAQMAGLGLLQPQQWPLHQALRLLEQTGELSDRFRLHPDLRETEPPRQLSCELAIPQTFKELKHTFC